MRVQAPTPVLWFVWHCEQCRRVDLVYWVDDVLNAWSEYVYPFMIAPGGEPMRRIRHAKKIRIIPSKALILINPVDDEEPEAQSPGLTLEIEGLTEPAGDGITPEEKNG